MSDIEATKERNIAVCNVVGIASQLVITFIYFLFYFFSRTYVRIIC